MTSPFLRKAEIGVRSAKILLERHIWPYVEMTGEMGARPVDTVMARAGPPSTPFPETA